MRLDIKIKVLEVEEKLRVVKWGINSAADMH